MLTETLPVKLTDSQILERGQQLARVHLQLADEEVEKEAINDLHKERVGALEAEASVLARAIRAGQEDREVQVEEQEDLEAREVRTVRLDTGEIVHRQAMTPQDLQRPLLVLTQDPSEYDKPRVHRKDDSA